LRVSNPCTNSFILSQQGKGSDDCDHRNLKAGQSLPDKCNSKKGMSSKSDKGKGKGKGGKGKGKGGKGMSKIGGKGKGKGGEMSSKSDKGKGKGKVG